MIINQVVISTSCMCVGSLLHREAMLNLLWNIKAITEKKIIIPH